MPPKTNIIEQQKELARGMFMNDDHTSYDGKKLEMVVTQIITNVGAELLREVNTIKVDSGLLSSDDDKCDEYISRKRTITIIKEVTGVE